jgi:hypothetical protein
MAQMLQHTFRLYPKKAGRVDAVARGTLQ